MTDDRQVIRVVPSTCENPHADCYREPDLEARWVEDFTSENEYNQYWLCQQCFKMLERGTMVSRSNLQSRENGFRESIDES